MCAIYGFLNYGRKAKNRVLKSILRELSIAAECRGTDATGISYINNNEVITFKKAKPAHKVKLYFPENTKAVLGHTRMTTQGNEKYNFNNHPFEGRCGNNSFALAHNGVLYNDAELKKMYNLPETQIETDSYVAVQLLEQGENLNAENIKRMAELVDGSFVFTILRNDNTLFLVKGSNPLTLYHFPTLGLYIYASTRSILDKALKKAAFTYEFCEIEVTEGDILEISPDGSISKSTFEVKEKYHLLLNSYRWDISDWYGTEDIEEDDLLAICNCFGVDREDVEFLYSCGYTPDEIEEMLFDTDLFEETLNEVKALLKC
ncbi:MAG: class II glutamine amidotransferase [Porcipelethomonas sp.]